MNHSRCHHHLLTIAAAISMVGLAHASPPGDATNDLRVNLDDIALIIQNWDQIAPPAAGDLNEDGIVDIADVAIVILNWGIDLSSWPIYYSRTSGDWNDPFVWEHPANPSVPATPGESPYNVVYIRPGHTIVQSQPVTFPLGYYQSESGATHVLANGIELNALSVSAYGTVTTPAGPEEFEPAESPDVGHGAPMPVIVIRNAAEVTIYPRMHQIIRVYDPSFCELVQTAPWPFSAALSCAPADPETDQPSPTGDPAPERDERFEVSTHRAITDVACDNSKCRMHAYLKDELGFSAGLDARFAGRSATRTAKEWVVEGAEREDDDRRYLRHFYQGHNARGLNIAGQQWRNSYAWTTWDSSDNEWSFEEARRHFHIAVSAGDPAERARNMAWALRALGQVAHLVEDLGSVAHTRNDPHPAPLGDGDPLELYGGEHFSTVAQLNTLRGVRTDPPGDTAGRRYRLDVALPRHAKLKRWWDSFQWQGQSDFDGFTTEPGLAEYSNFNFWTKDTVAETDENPRPTFGDTNIAEAFPRKDRPDRYVPSTARVGAGWRAISKTTPTALGVERIDVFAMAKDKGVKLLEQCFTSGPAPRNIHVSVNDDAVSASYLRIIIPRTIAHATALINWFFRGRVDIKLTQVSDSPRYEIRITSRSTDTLGAGSWTLYHDDGEGTRTKVTSSVNDSYPRALAPGASFTGRFTPVARGKGYTLVFKGTLDDETGTAIIAKRFDDP